MTETDIDAAPPAGEAAAPPDVRSLALEHRGGRRGAPRRRRRRWIRWAIWGVLLLATGAFFGRQAIEAATVPLVETTRVVRVSPIADREITTANGYVVARTRASVASKVQGRLIRVLVDEGDVVEAGQQLAEVEHEEQDAAIEEATARLAAARANIDALQAALEEAAASSETQAARLDQSRVARTEAAAVLKEREASFQRTSSLFDQSIANRAALDTAREALDVAKARSSMAGSAVAVAERAAAEASAAVEVSRRRLAVAGHEVLAAEAVLKRAVAIRQNAFITAPFGGTVLRREAEPGEVVSPANTGASGSKTAVVTLADFATLEVEVDVYERDIARVEADTPCRIVLDAYTRDPLAGKVRLLRPTADRTRATIQVYVVFDAVPAHARPEMGARVTFMDPGTDVLTPDRVEIPATAIVQRDGRDGAYLMFGREAKFVPLQLGGEAGVDRVVAIDGLEGGEALVLAPASDWADALRVRVAE